MKADAESARAFYETLVKGYEARSQKFTKSFWRSLRGSTAFIAVFILLQLVSAIGLVYINWGYDTFNDTLQPVYENIDSLMINSFFNIMLLTLFISVWFRIKFKRRLSKYKMRPLSSLPEIKNVIEPLCEKFYIPLSSVDIALVLNGSVLPSVEEAKGRIVLMLPLGALKRSKSEPELIRAAVAHEFGHVKHKDVSIWKISDAYAHVYHKWISRTYIFILAFGGFMIFERGDFAILLPFAIAANFGRQIVDVMKFRMESEIMADLAAAHATSEYGIIAVIEKYVVQRQGRRETLDSYKSFLSISRLSVHPTKEKRIAAIREGMAGTLKPTQYLEYISNSADWETKGQLIWSIFITFFFFFLIFLGVYARRLG